MASTSSMTRDQFRGIFPELASRENQARRDLEIFLRGESEMLLLMVSALGIVPGLELRRPLNLRSEWD